MKEEILKKLKVICLTKLNNSKKQSNQHDIELFSIILDVLNTKNSIEKLEMEVVINMINDLVDDINKAKEIYLKLI